MWTVTRQIKLLNLSKSFQVRYLSLVKGNADKCYLLVSTNTHITVNIGNFDINNTRCKKLLGVKFDQRQKFDDQILLPCKTTSRKVHALAIYYRKLMLISISSLV